MKRNLGYLLSLTPAAVAIGGNLTGGWYTLGNLVFSFGILGLAEILLPSNRNNAHSGPGDLWPEAILNLHVVMHLGVLASLFYGIKSEVITGPWIFWAALSSGAEAGSGAIIAAHELVHKAKPWKQFWGKVLLALSGNIYFYVHHLRIHHRLVGTAADAATARRGESLYRFQVRSIYQQILQGWDSEAIRLQKRNQPVYSFRNILLQNLFFQVIIAAAVFYIAGIPGLLAWGILVLLANLLLEYVNYIEHYGLVRNPATRVSEIHSWNCDKVVSRFFLIELSRHADHHFHASKPYHTLNTSKKSPVLPAGYASLVIPALIPPLWRALVHPRLDALLQESA